VQKEEKTKENFFESLIAHISGMVEGIFIKFGMCPSLSGGNLHSKFDAIRIRHHRATDAKKEVCCSCQYAHSICACPVS